MDVSAPNEAQSRYLAKKKQELHDEENALLVARAQAERQRLKDASADRDKTDRTLVEISRAGEQQIETAKRMNSERVKNLSESQQKTYEALAQDTASRITAMQGEALKAIDSHRASTTEKLLHVSSRAEDPFYRIKSLGPILSEADGAYTIRITLPEHEAQNLMVSGEGQSIKLALSRRFQDKSTAPEGNLSTRTSSFQSVVENVLLPGPFDTKKIRREYVDGAVVVTVPKPAPAVLKTEAVDPALS